MKITLGTVQFGLNYGVTNNDGKPSLEEIKKILNLAKSKEINQLDTAPSYGDIEEKLGTINVKGFSIYTKTPHFQNNDISLRDIKHLEEVFEQTLQQLKINEVEGLLIHNVYDCYKDNSKLLFAALQKLKSQSRVKKIGVSVYDPNDIEMILSSDMSIDMVQFPMNILDQRLLQSGLLQKLKEKEIELHVRSVFLQGILVGDVLTIPQDKYEYVQKYFEDLKKYKLTKLEAALLFIKQIKEIDYVLLGVNSLEHLQEIIEALQKIDVWSQHIDFSKYACQKISIIDPRKW